MADHRHAVIVGGQRCGSTLLAEILGAHPDILLAHPTKPEPKFFLHSSDHSEYHSRHFSGEAAVLLEKSTTYFERPDVEQRMRTIPGGVWPIVILRDPAERAISNWRFSTQNGLESLPAEIALTDEMAGRPYPETLSTSPFAYLDRSRYMSVLEPWLKVRGMEGMSIVLFERLLQSPHEVVSSIHRDLGLPDVDPGGLSIVNPSEKSDDLEPKTLSRLREALRPAAEEVAGVLPDARGVWPTLDGR